MVTEEVFNLLRKRGLHDTFQILVNTKKYQTGIHEFYEELNKFSYYNSFNRVRDDLIDNGIVNIEKNGGKKQIYLTKKGIKLYNKLQEIEEMIKKKDS